MARGRSHKQQYVQLVCTDREQHKAAVLATYRADASGDYDGDYEFVMERSPRTRRGSDMPQPHKYGPDVRPKLMPNNEFDMSVGTSTLACPRCPRKPQFKEGQLLELVRGAAEAGLNTIDLSKANK